MVLKWSNNNNVCVCVCVCCVFGWNELEVCSTLAYPHMNPYYTSIIHKHTIWGQRTDWAGSGHCQKVTALPSSVCVTTNNKGGKHSTQHPRPLVASSDFTVQLRLLLPQLAPQLVTRLTLQHARGVPYSTDHGWFNWQGSKSLTACVCLYFSCGRWPCIALQATG